MGSCQEEESKFVVMRQEENDNECGWYCKSLKRTQVVICGLLLSR